MQESRKILIVDDEESARKVMANWLVAGGYEVDQATDAEDALQRLAVAAESFSLIILDIMMPGLSGIDLLRKLKEDFPDPGVIMVTAVDNPEVAATTLGLGAYGYIIKPFERNELLIAVAQALRTRSLERKSRDYLGELEQQVRQRTSELEQACRDLKSSQAQMIQQEKLAVIGQLAAGVAHEIKNPVGYVTSNLGTLTKHLGRMAEFIRKQSDCVAALSVEKAEELKAAGKSLKIDFVMEDCSDIIRECREGLERIRSIVENLKSFSRKDRDQLCAADIHDCLDKALSVAWNELKYKATPEKDYGDIPPLQCYPNQLSQIFINLLVNAAHAIEGQGRILIKTSRQGESAVVAISDTGCGISPENQQKIFEPFFTTKAAGVGTGLGLSIVRDIVDRHHGDLQVESREGEGTTFTLRLPISQPPVTEAAE